MSRMHVSFHLALFGSLLAFALIAGVFQENYPAGATFGHAAALVRNAADKASAKKHALRTAGAWVVDTLDEIPRVLAEAGIVVR